MGLITLPPSSADCFEISQPHPPGTLRGCSGLYRSCFTLPIWTPTIKTYLFNVATIQRAGQLRMEVRFVANANLFLSGPHINAETNITSYPLRSGSTFLDVERVARQYICLVSWLHPIPPPTSSRRCLQIRTRIIQPPPLCPNLRYADGCNSADPPLCLMSHSTTHKT